jgi:multiple sugar transport system substrate-binding protein
LKKIVPLTSSILLMLSIAAGCSGNTVPANSGNAPVTMSNEPITLVFFTAQNSNYAKEEGFQKEIGKYIKAKFPNITIEHIHKATGQDYPELIAAGKIPDIVLDNNTASKIVENGLHNDLTPLIKKYNFDLGRINPAIVSQLKNTNPEGKIYGLPFTQSNFIMYYNKSIFDKFGVGYPKDGMSYDEVYELAKKLSRTDNGITYKGFMAHAGLMLTYNQLSLPPLSLKEDKANLQTDDWKKLVDNFLRFYQIPNNPYTAIDDFPKGEMAMGVHVSEKVVNWYEANKDLNFDIVSPPSFADKPSIGLQPNPYVLYITQQSKYKDQAFQVISYLLSDEVQIELSKDGVVTPLESKAVHQVYGQNLPQLKGKNTQAVFYNKSALPPDPRAANLVSYGVNLGRVFDLILKEGKDVNTALRTVEEESNQKINELKAAKK